MSFDIIKIPPFSRPITILACTAADKQKQLEQEIVMPFFQQDRLIPWVASYWHVISPDTGEDGGHEGSRAYNMAMEQTDSPIIAFSTGDVFIPKAVFWNAHLGLAESGNPIMSLRMDQQEDGSWKENIDAIGDYMLVYREWALAVGGFDERMKHWGYADYDFFLRLKASGHEPLLLGNNPRDMLLHRWHPRREDEWYREQNAKNKRIVKEHGPWTREMYLEARREMADEKEVLAV
jgi:hypothetical protein